MKRRRAAEGENDQNKGGELSDLESNLGRPFVGFFVVTTHVSNYFNTSF